MPFLDGERAPLLPVASASAATAFCSPVCLGRAPPGRAAWIRATKRSERAGRGRAAQRGGEDVGLRRASSRLTLVGRAAVRFLFVVVGMSWRAHCWAVRLTVSALSCALDFSSSACCWAESCAVSLTSDATS